MRRITILQVLGIILAATSEAHAEPALSAGHRPLLWVVVALGTLCAALLPHGIRKWSRSKRPVWVFWLGSTVLVVLCVLFVAPLIVALGSIILTGRTM